MILLVAVLCFAGSSLGYLLSSEEISTESYPWQKTSMERFPWKETSMERYPWEKSFIERYPWMKKSWETYPWNDLTMASYPFGKLQHFQNTYCDATVAALIRIETQLKSSWKMSPYLAYGGSRWKYGGPITEIEYKGTIVEMLKGPALPSKEVVVVMPWTGTPSRLESLNMPLKLKSLKTPFSLKSLETLSGIKSFDTLLRAKSLNTQFRLKKLKTPSGLESLETPSTFGSLRKRTDKESLETPSTLDSLETPSTMESLKTPSSLEILKTPSSLESYRTGKQFRLRKLNTGKTYLIVGDVTSPKRLLVRPFNGAKLIPDKEKELSFKKRISSYSCACKLVNETKQFTPFTPLKLESPLECRVPLTRKCQWETGRCVLNGRRCMYVDNCLS